MGLFLASTAGMATADEPYIAKKCISDGDGGQGCTGVYQGEEGTCIGNWHEDKDGSVTWHDWTCVG